MARVDIKFHKTSINKKIEWSASILIPVVKNSKNKVNASGGEENCITKEKAYEKIEKGIKKLKYDKDEIYFNSTKVNSKDEVIALIEKL